MVYATKCHVHGKFPIDGMASVSTLIWYHTFTNIHINNTRSTYKGRKTDNHKNIFDTTCFAFTAATCITLLSELITDIKKFLCTAGLKCFCFSKVTHFRKSCICWLDLIRLKSILGEKHKACWWKRSKTHARTYSFSTDKACNYENSDTFFLKITSPDLLTPPFLLKKSELPLFLGEF